MRTWHSDARERREGARRAGAHVRAARDGAADRRADGEADAPRAAPGHRRGGVGAPGRRRDDAAVHRAVRLPDAGEAVVGAVRRDDRLLRDGRLARGRAAAAAARGAAAAALIYV